MYTKKPVNNLDLREFMFRQGVYQTSISVQGLIEKLELWRYRPLHRLDMGLYEALLKVFCAIGNQLHIISDSFESLALALKNFREAVINEKITKYYLLGGLDFMIDVSYLLSNICSEWSRKHVEDVEEPLKNIRQDAFEEVKYFQKNVSPQSQDRHSIMNCAAGIKWRFFSKKKNRNKDTVNFDDMLNVVLRTKIESILECLPSALSLIINNSLRLKSELKKLGVESPKKKSKRNKRKSRGLRLKDQNIEKKKDLRRPKNTLTSDTILTKLQSEIKEFGYLFGEEN